MAYRFGESVQTATANGPSYTVSIGPHATNDIIGVWLSNDGGGTTIAPDATAVTAGWVMVGTQAASGACRGAIALCRATSGAMSNPTFTGANDDWIATSQVFRDVPTSWNLSALVDGVDYKRTDWNNVNSSASGALTTPDNGRLLVYSWTSDGSNQYMRCRLNEATALDKYATANINHIIGYRQQQTAAAAPSVTMYNVSATEGGNGWVLAIPNATNGSLQPDVRPTITELKWHGSWEAQHDSITWQAPNSFAASINGTTCSSTAPTTSITNTQPQTPWGVSTSLASSESTAGSWVGGTFSISSTDLSGKIFALQYSVGVSSTSSLVGSEGVLIGFSDGTNWVAYQVTAKAKGWFLNFEDTAFIAIGNATPYASSGTINWSAVTRLAYFTHRVGSSASSVPVYVRAASLFGPVAITGGGVSRPLTFNDFQSAMVSWGTWKWAELTASRQVKAKSSVQIGDGTNATYFDGEGSAFEFPQEWSATIVQNWQMDWNVNASQVSLIIKASAADTISLAAGAAATDTLQGLTIHADSHADATYNLAQAFVGFAPMLNTSIPVANATFSSCAEVDGKGADLTNVTVKKTVSTDAAYSVTDNGAVFDGVTIDVTGTSAAYHLELGTAVTAITLTDVAFTGTPGTDKVRVLKTTGTVTITISGTTSLAAGDVTSAGATVVISAPQLYQSVTITNLVVGSRVQIYDTTSSAELANEVAAGTSVVWTDADPAVSSRAIRVRIAYVSGVTAKHFIEASIGTCGVTDGTEAVAYLANQTDDDVYVTNAIDGSAVSGVTFTDAATDLVNVNVPGGTISWGQIYAATAYWLFGAVGIANDIAMIDAPDPANYRFAAMKVKNTSSGPVVPLTITGGYGYDATSGSISDVIDTSAGSIFPMPDHVVSKVVTVAGGDVITGDIATVLAAIPSSATNAAAVLSAATTTPIHANIKQVNSLAVDGAGTEADPWGPV